MQRTWKQRVSEDTGFSFGPQPCRITYKIAECEKCNPQRCRVSVSGCKMELAVGGDCNADGVRAKALRGFVRISQASQLTRWRCCLASRQPYRSSNPIVAQVARKRYARILLRLTVLLGFGVSILANVFLSTWSHNKKWWIYVQYGTETPNFSIATAITWTTSERLQAGPRMKWVNFYILG